MDKFWDSCTGSELSGYFKNKLVFKIIVYTISKPTIYKICLYELDGNLLTTLFEKENEAQEIILKWVNDSPISIVFNEHKIVDIYEDGKLKIPPIKTNFLNKLLSPKGSPKNSPKGSPKHSPKSRSPSPKSKTPSPKNSPIFNKFHNHKVSPK